MYKQIIIVRKDLNMSIGKICSQVSHASMAFLTWMIRNNAIGMINEKSGRAWVAPGIPQYYKHPDLNEFAEIARKKRKRLFYYNPSNPDNPNGKLTMCEHPTLKEYFTAFSIDKDLYEQWINGEFTKCILEAKNKNQLLRAKSMAEELGMVENEDFWLIYDACKTELKPEFIDENGIGRTLTCIGFRPMDNEIIDQIGKKYHLYV